MTMIDNHLGFGAALGAGDGANAVVLIKNNKMYGETESLDCPGDGSFCNKLSKIAFYFTGVTTGSKGLHILPGKNTPIHKVKTSGTWNGRQILENNEFIGFDYETRYGQPQRLF